MSTDPQGQVDPLRRATLGRLGLLAALACGAARGETREVVYGWPESMLDDARSELPITLLTRALQRSGAGYALRPARRDLTQSRTLRHLRQGRGDIDVAWTFSSTERERELLPIRIPLDRGLLGWRLPLIRAADAARFAALPDADALRRLRCAQGHDWPDHDVLRDNGFRVLPAPTYDSLFAMLARGRVAHVPRSLGEIRPEVRGRAEHDLAVAPDWVIHYPAPLYFFVSPLRPALAAAIEDGLRRMLADGSFEALFLDRYGEDLRAARLDQRRRVTLRNRRLPEATPLSEASLWFRPEAQA